MIEITAEIRALIDKAAAGMELAGDEYIDPADGFIHCKKCGGQRQTVVPCFGKPGYFMPRCICQCQREAEEQRKAVEERQRRMERIKRRKAQGLQDRYLYDYTFANDNTQLFNLLCDKADDVYGGKLPIHVRCLIDECANIGQIPQLEKLVATIRSREISACLVLQTRSQLKAIYKDNADTIVGNMDSQIFLGGSEPTTLKELSEALGKETIDSYNNSDTRGNSPSYGTNYQKLGHELLSRDEIAVLDGDKCILQLRGVRPFLSDKYDLTQHPNYKYTSDYDPKNALDIEKFLNRKEKIHPDDTFIMVDADSLPSA